MAISAREAFLKQGTGLTAQSPPSATPDQPKLVLRHGSAIKASAAQGAIVRSFLPITGFVDTSRPLATAVADAANAHWRRDADQQRPKLPKLAAFLDEAEADVLAYMTFPVQATLHRYLV
jgi:hypothetical protein